MIEETWRLAAEGHPADRMDGSMVPCARARAATKTYAVSSKLKHVDWNAERVRCDLGDAARTMKVMSGKGIIAGDVQMPLAPGGITLIDEYEFIVHPGIACRSPNPFTGLPSLLGLKLMGSKALASGTVVLQDAPKR